MLDFDVLITEVTLIYIVSARLHLSNRSGLAIPQPAAMNDVG